MSGTLHKIPAIPCKKLMALCKMLALPPKMLVAPLVMLAATHLMFAKDQLYMKKLEFLEMIFRTLGTKKIESDNCPH